MEFQLGDTMRSYFGHSLLGALLLALGSCGAAQVKAPTPVAVPAAPPVPPPSQPPREHAFAALLAEAEVALNQGRLTLPVHDNAYDRFQAVQLLDADNQQARAGLQSILLVYVDRINQALAADRLQAANAELRQAQAYFSGADLLRPLAEAVRKRNHEVAQNAPASGGGRERIVLPAQPLSRKAEEVRNLLVQLAQRVRQSDESVMIYARSDAEGRWIYKTMKDAVDEYRIRGDIRITNQPAVVLLAPLEESN